MKTSKSDSTWVRSEGTDTLMTLTKGFPLRIVTVLVEGDRIESSTIIIMDEVFGRDDRDLISLRNRIIEPQGVSPRGGQN